MSKILYVSSEVQAVLMNEIFIPELIEGFWRNHRPLGHGMIWSDVQVKVTEDGTLGPVGFQTPRNYNFLNLDFALPNEERLVLCAQSVKANSNFKSIKKELIELGRIVGSRLTSLDAKPVKLFRGNHKEGTVTVSSARARCAANTLIAAGEFTEVITPITTPPKAFVKKTVMKAPAQDSNVVITKTVAGATVRRIAVQPV
jgi:hypothetical protein